MLLWLLLVSTHPVALGAPSMQTATECVILLHGLARTSHSLRKLERALGKAGFVTVNLGYPSREDSVEALAADVIPRSVAECRQRDTRVIHFVTHSLGGILVRQYLGQNRLAGLGRVVMLSPPNQGSEAADGLRALRLYHWVNGPAGQQLGTGPDALPARLGPVDYPVGIIAGNRHAFFDGWLADLIPGDDDGKVAVERAKLVGMRDFLVVPHAHPFIMDADEVITQTMYFLRHGEFWRPAREAP
jgi:hypothetical protein